jgi:arginase
VTDTPPSARRAGVTLLGIRYDGSSSFLRGAADAPPLIREALWSDAGNAWTEDGTDLASGVVQDAGDVIPSADEAGRTEIETATERILASGRRPLVLGGDHSISFPVLRAVRRYHPRLAVLHLDAHPDLYDEFEGDRFSHACPFARVMEAELADRLVQVGIRTMNAHQRQQAERLGVEVIEMKDWRDGTLLPFDGPVYLSLDLDVLEPGLAPGMSHREPGGLSVRQVLAIIQSLEAPLVGADLVEFNPANDPTGLTAAVCAKLVKELAARIISEPAW